MLHEERAEPPFIFPSSRSVRRSICTVRGELGEHAILYLQQASTKFAQNSVCSELKQEVNDISCCFPFIVFRIPMVPLEFADTKMHSIILSLCAFWQA